jgi:hypothetical protein
MAAWGAKTIGEREVIRPQESETAGPVDSRDSLTRTFQRRTEPAVLPSQLQDLLDRTGFLRIAG